MSKNFSPRNAPQFFLTKNRPKNLPQYHFFVIDGTDVKMNIFLLLPRFTVIVSSQQRVLQSMVLLLRVDKAIMLPLFWCQH